MVITTCELELFKKIAFSYDNDLHTVKVTGILLDKERVNSWKPPWNLDENNHSRKGNFSIMSGLLHYKEIHTSVMVLMRLEDKQKIEHYMEQKAEHYMVDNPFGGVPPMRRDHPSSSWLTTL